MSIKSMFNKLFSRDCTTTHDWEEVSSRRAYSLMDGGLALVKTYKCKNCGEMETKSFRSPNRMTR